MRLRPAAVVLESAISPEFGAATGNVLSTLDADSQRADMVLFRVMFGVADALSRHDDPLDSEEWLEVKSKMYGEQLAVIGALATGAALIYGDRPKDTTYRRLLRCCSTAELDASFGARAAQNFRELLGDEGDGEQRVSAEDPVERVLMAEREAVLCNSAHAAAASVEEAGSSVVVLVGVRPRCDGCDGCTRVLAAGAAMHCKAPERLALLKGMLPLWMTTQLSGHLQW
jgi:hypothetical protein